MADAGGGGLGNALGGVGGLLAYLLSTGGESEYKQAVQVWQKIQDPNFDWTKLSAPELKVAAVLDPQTYNAVVPPEMKQVADSPDVRAAQGQALQGWQTIAKEGLPLQDRLAAEQAQGSVREAHRQAVESSLRDLQERGQTGGGQEIAMRLGAAQQAANLAGQQGKDLASQAIQNRLAALNQVSQQGSALRGQDIALSQAQANTYNQFHQWLSDLQTQAAKDAAQSRMQAAAYNTQNKQQIANANPMLQYQTQQENLNRYNQLQQQQFGNQVTKAAGTTGAMTALGSEQDRQRQALINAASAAGQGIGGALGPGGLVGPGGLTALL